MNGSTGGTETTDPRRAALGKVPPVPATRRRPAIAAPPPRRPAQTPEETAAPAQPSAPGESADPSATPSSAAAPAGTGETAPHSVTPSSVPSPVAPVPAPRPPSERSAEAARPGPGVERETAPTGARNQPAAADGDADDEGGDSAEAYGTRKGNLTYVSTSIPRPLSDAFDSAADGTTLGVVLMKAVRAHHREVREALTPEEHDPDDPFPAPQVRIYYRPPGGSIRRDIGVRPAEAAAIWRVAHDIGITPSAFMRMVLQREFASDTAGGR